MPAKAGISGEGAQQSDMARGGYTCLMTNKARGALPVGVTANLGERIERH
jgi:putative endonuclease